VALLFQRPPRHRLDLLPTWKERRVGCHREDCDKWGASWRRKGQPSSETGRVHRLQLMARLETVNKNLYKAS